MPTLVRDFRLTAERAGGRLVPTDTLDRSSKAREDGQLSLTSQKWRERPRSCSRLIHTVR